MAGGHAPEVSRVSLYASIARFAGLAQPEVSEQLETTWEDWISFLVTEPHGDFAGQMAASGWSPAKYIPARRNRDNVRQVFGLVLDHDKAGSWDALGELWHGSYGCIYTTKSHGASGTSGDRLRVVLPLARPVIVEEYARLWDWAARRATEVGCPPDPQCRDASRFWFDPSMPPGGWRAVTLHGEPIDPTAVLALLEPPKLRVVRPVEQIATDQKIRRAIAYLAKLPAAVSGASGHTTTFNAVAHVMFGFDFDPEVTHSLITEHYNPRCDPPWSERDLLHKIRSVAERCQRERGYLLRERPRIHTTAHASWAAPEAPAELDVDWTSLLLVKKDRSPRRAYHNTLTFVRHHPDYRGKWSIDLMTQSPWFDGQPITESTVHDIRAHADQRLGYTPGRDDVEAAIVTAASDRPFHPIVQYLRSLDWDGIPRLHAMARDYLGSEEPHHAEMIRRWMIGAAARVLRPGCKLDTALMLVGPQGIGKSTFFSILGGQWHADSFLDITNKDGLLQLHSAWIYELAELENVVSGRAESRLKAWMTSTHDMYRAPYQRTVIRRPRAVIICGTTNRAQFLTDDTGSRRFWIIPVRSRIPRELLAEMRDQLWGEAVCAAESGEPWWLDDAAETERAEANEDFLEQDSWTEAIGWWLQNPIITETSVTEILTDVFKLELAKHDTAAQMRVGKSLRVLGWRRMRTSRSGKREYRYVRSHLDGGAR